MSLGSLVQHVRRGHARLRDDEYLYMVLVGLLVGVGGGLAAIAFREAIGLGHRVAWLEKHYTLDYIRQLPAWWKIVAPAAGGFVCALIVTYLAREARGHGVAEVMEAVALHGGRIRPRVVFAKLFSSAISIASGGSAGREGPVVQIGSAFGSAVGQWLGLDERRLRTLVGCGAAAGIAASFNSPIAGVLFAIEVIVIDIAMMQFFPIVIASVVATAIARAYFGDSPTFAVHSHGMVSYGELAAYAALGLITGFAALAFVRTLYFTEDLFEAVKVWPPVRAVAGGALVGVVALWFPEVYGAGDEAIEVALGGRLAWNVLVMLALVKIIAVSLTLGSGGSGGIFAPSLLIGAATGGAVGAVVHGMWPEATASPGAYALVGMAAVVGAAMHAPLTAIVIIFELTGDYGLILPLMTSTILATLIARRLQYGSIYTIKLLRRGIDIYKGQDISLLRHLLVRDQMRTDATTIAPEAGVLQLVSCFVEHPGNSVFVTDRKRNLLGVVRADQCRRIMADAATFEAFLIVRDLMVESGFPTVGPDDNLADVMRRLSRYRGEVPVVAGGRLVGVMWPEDVIERYNAELFKRDMASGMAGRVREGPTSERLPGTEDTSLSEMPVPRAFVGRSIRSLDLRGRFDVTVLLVKQSAGLGRDARNTVPSADYVFKLTDVVLLMGPEAQLRRLERGLVEA